MTIKEKAQKYLDDNFSIINDKEDILYAMIGFAKEMEKEQKIEMLKSFLHDAQMGEDVEDVEAWFENYEKQQSFFKPVLGEPIWNIRTKQFKQQEQ
jgi:hypothetical protein